jgi:nucleoside-diphosphate-sugar epimerase
VVDSSVPGCGANLYNLQPVSSGVRIVGKDVGDQAVAEEIRGCSVIFNLAGEISHIHSMRYPERDASLNALSQLRFVEMCASIEPGIRVVYAGTRQIYGAPQYLPVNEEHPVRPLDFNGIHKYAAAQYHRIWSEMGRIDARVLRLSNVYGPRMALDIPCQGFLGNFLRRAMLRQTIEIFGDGRQLRDPLYIDDAVDAFLLAGAAEDRISGIWNAGGPDPLPLSEIAGIVSSESGIADPVLRPFPEEQKIIDIGSYTTDCTRIAHELGWQARVGFREGIRRSLDYYHRELAHYLKTSEGTPSCPLDGLAVTV